MREGAGEGGAGEDFSRRRIAGNDCNTNPRYLKSWLPLVADVLNVTTYHRYTGYGLDPNLVEKMMTPAYLDETVSSDIDSVHAEYAPHTQLWVGEAAAAWHSGRAGVTNAYASSFWWANALGSLAAHNHSAFCRQTLLGGYYGLLNRTTYEPNPDWYVAKLFHDLMGDAVLGVTGLDPGHGWLRGFAHCSRGGSSGHLAVLFVNIHPNSTFVVSGASLDGRSEYRLSAPGLASRTLSLNGAPLAVSGGKLPVLAGQPAAGSTLSVGPREIVFATLPKAQAAGCRQPQ